jgi:hypothetical protein
MDKNDVRTVLHACVPETIDRFYQEVGRGGRDGKACVSFTVFTNADLKMAKGLSRKRVIGIEKGFARWRAMYTGREIIGDEADLFRVDLNSRPFHVRGDSDGNKAWNLRTLILMARTGLISLESERPPLINLPSDNHDCSESDAWSSAMQKYFSSRVVRAMSGHLDNNVWRERAEVVRRQIRGTDEQSFLFMEDVLWGRREISNTLCKIYQIPEIGVEVSPSCGGCHICRQQGQRETAATGCFLEAPSLTYLMSIKCYAMHWGRRSVFSQLYIRVRDTPAMSNALGDGNCFASLIDWYVMASLKLRQMTPGLRRMSTENSTSPHRTDSCSIPPYQKRPPSPEP